MRGVPAPVPVITLVVVAPTASLVATIAIVAMIAAPTAVVSIAWTYAMVPVPSTVSLPIVPLLASSIRPPVIPSLRPPFFPPVSLSRIATPRCIIAPMRTAPFVSFFPPVLPVLALIDSSALAKRPAVILMIITMARSHLFACMTLCSEPLLAVIVTRATVIDQLVFGHRLNV